MKNWLQQATTATGIILLLWSCAGLGPRANISVVEAEVKKAKKVGNIIVANPIGVEPDSNLSRALVAISLRSYGNKATPQSEFRPLLQTLDADSLANVLTAPYQAGFLKVLGRPNPKRIQFRRGKTVASAGSAKQVADKLLEEGSQVAEMTSAIYAADSAQVSTLARKEKATMELMGGLNRYVFKKMKAKYVLLTYFNGTEEDYESGKPLTLVAGLVNVRTGKLRYFATVTSTKEELPVPYAAHVGVLGNTLFEQINEIAPLR